LLATSLVARLPAAMANLAIILRVAEATGSYARAGGVTAAYVVGTGIVTPVLGRLADRTGRRPVLLLTAAVNAAGLISLAFIPVSHIVVVLVVAAVAGASLPPVVPAVRSLWAGLVPTELQSGLYAMDATMQEATFMAGPTLVALLSSLSGPPAALVACGVIGLAGTAAVSMHPAMVASTPSAAGAEPRRRSSKLRLGRFQPAGIPGLGSLVVIVLVFLAAILVVEVTVVAFAGHAGAKNQSGILLAVWATGSMAGGFLFGARAAGRGARVLAPVLVGSALGFLALVAAPGVAVLYGLLFLAGMSIAPSFSCIYGLVGGVSPADGSVEAFSWIASGIQMGAAGGAALGGLLVDDVGTHWSFAFAGGCGLLTAAIAWWRSHNLQAA
jgi:MFS family permease